MSERINHLADIILRVMRITTVIAGIFLVFTVENWVGIIAIFVACIALFFVEELLIKKFGVVHPNRSSSNREESE